MAKIEKQNKFVELRAEGMSFAEISKAINVSKPTLIKWSKELKEKIEEIASDLEDAFRTEQRLKRTLRARLLANELDEAYKALSKTNYEKMSKKDLISIIEKLEEKLNSITGLDKEMARKLEDIIGEHMEEGKEIDYADLLPENLGFKLKDNSKNS